MGKAKMTETEQKHCHIGTSGWVYNHWQEVFYPPGLPSSRWFEHYSQHFDTVEVNYSFYRLPSENAFDQWREQAPPGFTYTIKANRYITHLKRLKDAAEPVQKFLSRARRLGDGLGAILWQLPPRWKPAPTRLEAFVSLLPDDLTHAFEFRDERWFIKTIRDILRSHNLAFCIFDMPAMQCPKWVTSDIVYLRFHGSGTVYGGRYGHGKLLPWAVRIKNWLTQGLRVYAYFNNDAFGYAIEDARTLKALLGSETGADRWTQMG